MTNRRISGGKIMSTPSAYAGGYSDSIRRQLESVNLPDKVRCKVCRKWRMQNAYSKRQLEILRNAIVVQGQRALNGGHATCRTCTGGQTMELKCCQCETVKGLDEFAINQRKEHENARCLVCVQGHADAEPVLDENKLLTEGTISATQRTVTASQFGTGSFAESSRHLTLSDAPGYSRGSSYQDVDDNASDGGVFIEPERHNASAYNSRGQATGDARSVHSGWASWGVQGSNVPSSVRSDGENRKFAKIKAWRPETDEKPPVRLPETRRCIGESDDEDDDGGITDYL
ncbi:Stc1 domain-containing protein [Aspergillus egyptiacus]|nr:Stc1 domain-containing protein [Aspergillus egyptiacus]